MHPKKHSNIEKAIHYLDKSIISEVFKDDHYFLFLYKKIERISAAIYILSELLSDSEPLHRELRSASLGVLKDIISFKDRPSFQSRESVSTPVLGIIKLQSLLDLSYISDLISPMNYSVIRKELEIVLEIIESREKAEHSGTIPALFSKDFFEIPKELFPPSVKGPISSSFFFEEGREKDTTPSGNVRTIADFEKKEKEQGAFKGHNSVKDIADKRQDIAKERNTVSQNKSHDSSVMKDTRRKTILDFMNGKKNLTIKDFSSVIMDCGEKTIQRELLALVAEGLVKKEGDRRWSRYSLSFKS